MMLQQIYTRAPQPEPSCSQADHALVHGCEGKNVTKSSTNATHQQLPNNDRVVSSQVQMYTMELQRLLNNSFNIYRDSYAQLSCLNAIYTDSYLSLSCKAQYILQAKSRVSLEYSCKRGDDRKTYTEPTNTQYVFVQPCVCTYCVVIVTKVRVRLPGMAMNN